MLAELGVGTVILCGAERVEKSFFTSKVLAPEKVSQAYGLYRCLVGGTFLAPKQQNRKPCRPWLPMISLI